MSDTDRGGRPTKRTPSTDWQILQLIYEGYLEGQAADMTNIHPRTLGRWKREDEWFGEMIGHARRSSAVMRHRKQRQLRREITNTRLR